MKEMLCSEGTICSTRTGQHTNFAHSPSAVLIFGYRNHLLCS